jgi:imidazolonepropionase-like amidohydrolase
MRRSQWWVLCASVVLTASCERGSSTTPEPTPRVGEVGDDEDGGDGSGARGTTAVAVRYAGAGSTVIRDARVMTATGVIYERATVIVIDGRIAAVAEKVAIPEDAEVIDGSGLTLTPGIIDTHSHIGVYASPGLRAHSDGNEVVGPVTAHVRAQDGYWPQDPQIDHARAGGVTTMQILPGSANLIGGRSVTVKLLPGARSVDDVIFAGAPFGLKMACGENPKRVYGEKGGPSTRMGNVAGYRKAFQQAKEYAKRFERYEERKQHWEARKAKGDGGGDGDASSSRNGSGEGRDGSGSGMGGPPDPPGRDLGLETLAGVLAGEILVHNHCYRADEMSLMLDLADEFGFKIRSFHHAVEAYKIADRLAAADTGASVWADWWGFKAEAYDGILENAAMISAAGARAIIHSDSATGIQRLNQEAAKAMYTGRDAGFEISENEALRWITANPAWALGIADETGTIEVGKAADLVLWNGSPFSVYAKATRVLIDGRTVYDRNDGESRRSWPCSSPRCPPTPRPPREMQTPPPPSWAPRSTSAMAP